MVTTKTSLEFLRQRFKSQTVLNIKTKPPISITNTVLKYEKSDIFQSLYSKDLLNLSEEEIQRIIKRTIKTEKPQNGGQASFFRIPDTDYGVRILRYSEIHPNAKVSFNLTAVEKKNHIVAKIGENIQIMRFIEGTNSFVPKLRFDNKMKQWTKQYNLNEQMLSFPIKSYKNLIEQIIDAGKLNMTYDEMGANLIAKKSKKKFTIIDFGFKEYTKLCSLNPISQLQVGFSVYENHQYLKLLKKCLLAMAEVFTPQNKLPIPVNKLKPSIGEDLIRFQTIKLPFEDINEKLNEITNLKEIYDLNPTTECRAKLEKTIKSFKNEVGLVFGDHPQNSQMA